MEGGLCVESPDKSEVTAVLGLWQAGRLIETKWGTFLLGLAPYTSPSDPFSNTSESFASQALGDVAVHPP